MAITTLEIIRGISQAAANAKHDGAHIGKYAADGVARTMGLAREEGCPVCDERVMDGFSVSFYGNLLCMHYHTELTLKELHNLKDLDHEIDSRINGVVKFLKSEYKKVTGNTLSLTEEGEVQSRAEYMSKIRSWVTAKKYYKIGGLTDVEVVKAETEDKLDDTVKKWLALGGLSKK
jgi:hypothetical protein